MLGIKFVLLSEKISICLLHQLALLEDLFEDLFPSFQVFPSFITYTPTHSSLVEETGETLILSNECRKLLVLLAKTASRLDNPPFSFIT